MLNMLIKTPNRCDLIRVSKWINLHEPETKNEYFNFCGQKIFTFTDCVFGYEEELPSNCPDFIQGVLFFGISKFYLEVNEDNTKIRVYKEG